MEPDAALERAIGVGASAGGLDALIRLVRSLPDDLDAPILVVLHLAPTGRSRLPEILGRNTALDVRVAEDGMPLERGTIHVAPADRHLLVRDGRMLLERGPKENGSRPAVDPMLRTLAAEFGSGAIAVILSGALGDGSAGARAVARAGGAVLVQDPADATISSMPETALAAAGPVARVLRADELGVELGRLAQQTPMEDHQLVSHESSRPNGPPSGFSCPECRGPLWDLEDGGYRCRVGHAYSEDALVGAQGSAVETALWVALETLEERAEFLRRLARRYSDSRPELAPRMDAAANDADARADLLRRALAAGSGDDDALSVRPEAAV
jgi:two-component system chemotaxis response regulator CheB